MAHLGGHAIVIGASMGGLLAARALADHFDQVTILERDALPQFCEPRKGVPQGRHTHGLLARGREVLEQLFPGLGEELVAEGAISGDVVDGARLIVFGAWPIGFYNGGRQKRAKKGRPGSVRPSSESHFAQATRHVAEGRRIVTQQCARVARLEALGCDTSAAERLLSQFESTLSIFADDLRAAEAEAYSS
jgi:pimeloyl-ACP methyl ester carboxylesterase